MAEFRNRCRSSTGCGGDGESAGFDAAASRGVAAQAASNRGEELLEIVMRRYERTGTPLTSNRPVDDWGKYWVTAPPSPRCWTDCSIICPASTIFSAAMPDLKPLPNRESQFSLIT